MEANDVHCLEFLDLSEVDEHERNRVLFSLKQNDPSVQLPWIKSKPYSNARPSREVNRQAVISKNVTNHSPYHTPVSHVNDTFFNHNISSAVCQPTVINYNKQPSAVYYNQNVSYNYTQQLVTSSNIVNSSASFNSNNSLQYSNYERVSIGPNGSSNVHASHTSNTSFTEQNGTGLVNYNYSTPDADISCPLQNTEVKTVEPSVTPKPKFNENGVQNGYVQSQQPQENPSPANKSWASLFNSPKTGSISTGQNSENDLKKTSCPGLNAEPNNNEKLCPIKHPRKSQFVDPECYRMGEYLSNYAIDCKAISLQPRGLINQSNYCYINSILQALIACPPVYNLLSGLSQNMSSNENRKPTPVIDGMSKFVKEFQHLPAGQRVSRRFDKNQKKEQNVIINCDIPFEPLWIYKMLNGIRSDLIEGRQEDAEEFLGCLLNGLNDEMLELINLVKTDDVSNDSVKRSYGEGEEEAGKVWQVMGPKNKGSVSRRTEFGRTPISDIFGGFLKSKIHKSGDYTTENIQPFFTLPLNIEKVKTVREALDSLVSKYQLEGVTSSKTNEEVEAWQQVLLDELPVILILHLKCFDFQLDGCTKIIKALEFPIDLKIDAKLLSSKPNTPKEKQYKLFAVVYHDGKEASKGHYITDAFHVGYSSWLRYDDQSVKPVQEEQVLKPQGTRVPYLLFYRRSDTIRSK